MAIHKTKASSFRIIILSCLICLMSACGFQLRQLPSVPNDISTLLFASDSGAPVFDRYLLGELANRGITTISTTDNRQHADVSQFSDLSGVSKQRLELKVLKIETTDEVLSVATDNDVLSVSRTLKVTYFVRTKTGKSLYGPRFIQVNEVLYNQDADASIVTAQNSARSQAMYKELAKKLVHDLAYIRL